MLGVKLRITLILILGVSKVHSLKEVLAEADSAGSSVSHSLVEPKTASDVVSQQLISSNDPSDLTNEKVSNLIQAQYLSSNQAGLQALASNPLQSLSPNILQGLTANPLQSLGSNPLQGLGLNPLQGHGSNGMLGLITNQLQGLTSNSLPGQAQVLNLNTQQANPGVQNTQSGLRISGPLQATLLKQLQAVKNTLGGIYTSPNNLGQLLNLNSQTQQANPGLQNTLLGLRLSGPIQGTLLNQLQAVKNTKNGIYSLPNNMAQLMNLNSRTSQLPMPSGLSSVNAVQPQEEGRWGKTLPQGKGIRLFG